MLCENDRRCIRELAAKYHAKRVLLFGSSVRPDAESRDIDIAVEGIEPMDFFKFYGELIFKLSKPVDLVDLSQDREFTGLIRREGVPVYG